MGVGSPALETLARIESNTERWMCAVSAACNLFGRLVNADPAIGEHHARDARALLQIAAQKWSMLQDAKGYCEWLASVAQDALTGIVDNSGQLGERPLALVRFVEGLAARVSAPLVDVSWDDARLIFHPAVENEVVDALRAAGLEPGLRGSGASVWSLLVDSESVREALGELGLETSDDLDENLRRLLDPHALAVLRQNPFQSSIFELVARFVQERERGILEADFGRNFIRELVAREKTRVGQDVGSRDETSLLRSERLRQELGRIVRHATEEAIQTLEEMAQVARQREQDYTKNLQTLDREIEHARTHERTLLQEKRDRAASLVQEAKDDASVAEAGLFATRLSLTRDFLGAARFLVPEAREARPRDLELQREVESDMPFDIAFQLLIATVEGVPRNTRSEVQKMAIILEALAWDPLKSGRGLAVTREDLMRLDPKDCNLRSGDAEPARRPLEPCELNESLQKTLVTLDRSMSSL